jgi:hypothetical protein
MYFRNRLRCWLTLEERRRLPIYLPTNLLPYWGVRVVRVRTKWNRFGGRVRWWLWGRVYRGSWVCLLILFFWGWCYLLRTVDLVYFLSLCYFKGNLRCRDLPLRGRRSRPYCCPGRGWRSRGSQEFIMDRGLPICRTRRVPTFLI